MLRFIKGCLLCLSCILLNTGCCFYKVDNRFEAIDSKNFNEVLSNDPKTVRFPRPRMKWEGNWIIKNGFPRYFIIHTPIGDFHLDNVKIDNDLQIISGKLDEVSKKHQNHANSNTHFNKYILFKEKPKNEAHIYLKYGVSFNKQEGEMIKTPFHNIHRVEFYKGHFLINTYLPFYGLLTFLSMGT